MTPLSAVDRVVAVLGDDQDAVNGELAILPAGSGGPVTDARRRQREGGADAGIDGDSMPTRQIESDIVGMHLVHVERDQVHLRLQQTVHRGEPGGELGRDQVGMRTWEPGRDDGSDLLAFGHGGRVKLAAFGQIKL